MGCLTTLSAHQDVPNGGAYLLRPGQYKTLSIRQPHSTSSGVRPAYPRTNWPLLLSCCCRPWEDNGITVSYRYGVGYSIWGGVIKKEKTLSSVSSRR